MADGGRQANGRGGARLASGPGDARPANDPGGPRPASRPDERQARFGPIDCDRCGAAVLVAKFSPEQTSVQWTPAAVRSCAEFSARVAAGEQSALIASCGSLRASIDRAVLDGRVEVSAP